MANVSDYDSEVVKTCFSVLLELFTILGEYREHLALVGGWVASLILPGAEEKHIGTSDIDVLIDHRHLQDDVYDTILKLLVKRGYSQDKNQPYKFFRRLDNGKEVEIDFLAGEYSGTGRSRSTREFKISRPGKQEPAI